MDHLSAGLASRYGANLPVPVNRRVRRIVARSTETRGDRESLSHGEREGPAAKRWEGERFHRLPENRDSLRCMAFEALPSLRHGHHRQRPPPSPEPDPGREGVLEAGVRDRRLGSFKFLRQVSIDRYFADFVCETRKLIVELDGAAHEEQEDYRAGPVSG
jgi:hypothetical protein